MEGYYHSIESFGTVDGPGIRFVLFLQGCPMRCLYCHNPDTWSFVGGKKILPAEVLAEVVRYRPYLRNGGVTVSGGEPLRQMEFVTELFTLLKANKINTCLDTSGIYYSQTREEQFIQLAKVTDLVLLDIKEINNRIHQRLTGQSNEAVLAFARFLDRQHVPVWIRYVLVPGLTDDREDLMATRAFIDSLHNVKRVEVLPYHTLGVSKYKAMGLAYSLADVTPPDEQLIKMAERILVK